MSASRRNAVHSFTNRATVGGSRPSMTSPLEIKDARAEPLISHMEMRRIVVVKEHPHSYSKKVSDCRQEPDLA
jgi:hypothetical protein